MDNEELVSDTHNQHSSYATALDLNMGYYTNRLDPNASKTCTIIKESTLTCKYQLVLHVLQTASKLRSPSWWLPLNLFEQTSILVQPKGQPGWSPHKIEAGAHKALMHRLKVNAKKCSFCAIESEDPGYVLTRDSIKPQPKMVNAIFVLTLPGHGPVLQRSLGLM